MKDNEKQFVAEQKRKNRRRKRFEEKEKRAVKCEEWKKKQRDM